MSLSIVQNFPEVINFILPIIIYMSISIHINTHTCVFRFLFCFLEYLFFFWFPFIYFLCQPILVSVFPFRTSFSCLVVGRLWGRVDIITKCHKGAWTLPCHGLTGHSFWTIFPRAASSSLLTGSIDLAASVFRRVPDCLGYCFLDNPIFILPSAVPGSLSHFISPEIKPGVELGTDME